VDFRFVPPELARLDDVSAEIIACAIWQDERPLTGLSGLLDWRLAGRLSKLARETFVKGTLGEVLVMPGRPRLTFDKVVVLGLGPRAEFDDDAFRQAVGKLLATLEGLHVKRAVVELPGRGDGTMGPERAAELVLEHVARLPAHDAWVLVEPAETQKLVAQRAHDERRRSLHR
jgi:hypothetical protein